MGVGRSRCVPQILLQLEILEALDAHRTSGCSVAIFSILVSL